MQQNARFTPLTVFELLRENQQEEKTSLQIYTTARTHTNTHALTHTLIRVKKKSPRK